jgi:translation initiation factor 2 beta subunit (eIF-2beta)/eIF-5
MPLLSMDGSSNPDYRYQMQELELRSHGRRHIVSNLNTVSSNIGRTPELLISFLDLEVLKPSGMSPCRFDGGVVVPDGIDQRMLQTKVFEFIRKCIDCPRCRNPETNVVSVQGRRLELHCIACGAQVPTAQEFSTEFSDWMRRPEHKDHLRTVGERLRVERLMPRPIDPDDFVFPPTDDTTPSKEEWA